MTVYDIEIAIKKIFVQVLPENFNPWAMFLPDWFRVRFRPTDLDVNRNIANLREGVRILCGHAGEKAGFVNILKSLGEDKQSEDHVVNEVLALLLAGQNTASTLASSILYLKQAPEAYKTLMENLKDVKDTNNFADLDSIDYLDQIVLEALRLDPPAPSARISFMEDITILGYRIRAKAKFRASIFQIHRDIN